MICGSFERGNGNWIVGVHRFGQWAAVVIVSQTRFGCINEGSATLKAYIPGRSISNGEPFLLYISIKTD